MGKRRKPPPRKDKVDEASDLPTDPDPKSYSYYHDDIDAFHDRREKILLEKGPLDVASDETTSEEEVLAIDSSDESEEENITTYKEQIRHIREKDRKFKIREDLMDDVEDVKDGWGQKKSHYYGADIRDDDDIGLEEGEGDEAGSRVLEEEKEAIALQKKLAEQLDDEDFGIDSFMQPAVEISDSVVPQEKIQKDLSKMSNKEKLELFRNESPEFFELRNEFIDKMTIVNEVLEPIAKLVKDEELPPGRAADYVKIRLHLYLNYCLNINFYMVLKARLTPVQSHPVIKRILQYRNLIKQLEAVDKTMQPELEDILVKKSKGLLLLDEPLNLDHVIMDKTSTKIKFKKIKEKKEKKKQLNKKQVSNEHRPKVHHIETSGEREASLYYRTAHGLADTNSDDEQSGDEFDGDETKERITNETQAEEFDGKRAITYQIAKNKGLTAKQKKVKRNPRVKHRMKFKKALVKRRSMVREAKLPLQPYGGELRGIRASLKQGIKLH